MKRIRLSEVSEAVRLFVSQALQSGGVELQDETGRLRGSVVPYREPAPEERRRGQVALEKLWQKTSAAMQALGVTDDDVMRELLTDDQASGLPSRAPFENRSLLFP